MHLFNLLNKLMKPPHMHHPLPTALFHCLGLPPVMWNKGWIYGIYRNCLGAKAQKPLKFTPMHHKKTCKNARIFSTMHFLMMGSRYNHFAPVWRNIFTFIKNDKLVYIHLWTYNNVTANYKSRRIPNGSLMYRFDKTLSIFSNCWVIILLPTSLYFGCLLKC